MSLETNYNLSGELPILTRVVTEAGTQDAVEVLPVGSFFPRQAGTFLQPEALSTMYGGKEGSRLHYTIFNPDASDGDITLVSPEWGSTFRRPGAIAGFAELIADHPNRRFITYDNLGYGQSDPLPTNAAKEIARTGRFDTYAEIVLEGLGSLLKDYDRLDMLGRSLGGCVATEMAGQLDRVNSLIVFDPPSTPRPFASLSWAFWVKEAGHAQRYLKANVAPSNDDVEPQQMSDVVKGVLGGIATDLVAGRLSKQLLEAKGLAQGTYNEAVATALPNVIDRYVILSPDHSELNDPSHTLQLVEDAAKNAKRLPSIVAQMVFNGTHAFGFNNPRAIPALESFASSIQA